MNIINAHYMWHIMRYFLSNISSLFQYFSMIIVCALFYETGANNFVFAATTADIGRVKQTANT